MEGTYFGRKGNRRAQEVWRRIVSFVLSLALLIGSIHIPAYADVEYSDYLAGFKVDCLWSTLERDYTWDAVYDEMRQPKLMVTYRMENAQRDFPAGSIHFTVPGIGQAVRGTVVKADKLAADKETSEWRYTWDKDSDLYTFTNKFDVKQGQSLSGGFELLWKLDARKCTDGYEQEASPTFSIDGEGAITLKPLSYRFSSVPDRYRISWNRLKLSSAEYDQYDRAYTWYEYETRIENDYRSRGLYKSSYFISIEMSEDCTPDDVVVLRDGKGVDIVQDEEGRYGFYLFENRSGDLTYSTYNYTAYYSFYVGFNKEKMEGELVRVEGHLDRLYQDEDEWTETAGDYENVDVEDEMTVEKYEFQYQGYIYRVDKYNNDHENFQYLGYSYNHDEPKNYTDRMNAVNLYNGKVVQFTLYGRANRDYAPAARMMKKAAKFSLATDSNAAADDDLTHKSDSDDEKISKYEKQAKLPEDKIPEDVQDWNDFKWYQNEEILEYLEQGKDDLGNSITYSDMHSGLASPSNAEEHGEEDDDGKWFFLPDITIFGKLPNPFGMTAYAAETATASDAEEAEEPAEAKDDTLETEPPKKMPLDADGYTGVGENEAYSMILGDDKLAVTLQNGSIRNLEDEEYDIEYVTVPSDSKNYHYTVFAAQTQDAALNMYVPVGEGDTGSTKTIRLAPGYKAVLVRTDGIVGSSSVYAQVGVRFHLNWEEEQAKPEAERVDHEGKVVNFDYLRAVYGEEDITDNVVDASSYLFNYGETLAERDMDIYGEYRQRAYSHVWLRTSVTDLSASADIGEFVMKGRNGFENTVSVSGTIKTDNDGPLEKFSLYAELPDGLYVDLDAADVRVGGSGTYLNGGNAGDFVSFGTIRQTEMDGKNVIAVDFDFTGYPLNGAKGVSVNLSFPVTLSYVDFLTYGNRYRVSSYLLPHDGGLEKISGKSIREDAYDIDENGVTSEKMAYATDTSTALDDASEWRGYVAKFVKSKYSTGYVTDTVAKLWSDLGTKEMQDEARYSYRIDFGIGASNAKEIVLYDTLEQGATISENEDDPDKTHFIPSAWQGILESVNTSYAERLGMIPTVYYSTDENQEHDLEADGWTTEMPEEPVRAVAIYLDTSKMDKGVLRAGQLAYAVLNMKAPSSAAFVGKQAVNQYTVQYDSYSPSLELEATYRLPSSETYVKLLDTIGRIRLQKVDAERIVRTDEDGTVHYAPLTGAKFQVYGPDGKALFGEEGRALNSMGQIVINNIPFGQYSYEELEAPRGYQKLEGRHPFPIDGTTAVFEIKNYRIPGEVILTKIDQDDPEHPVLADAKFELFTDDGMQVFTDENYRYAEDGTVGQFVTDENGKIHITGLPWGSYYFTEVEAPEGYEVSNIKVRFSEGMAQYIEDEDRVMTEVSASDYQKTASILLKKTDAESGRLVRDAVYSLYRVTKDGDEIVSSGLKTNAAGEVTVNGLKFGKYYLMETRNPGGYLLPQGEDAKTEVVTLDTTTAGATVEVTHTDTRKTGSVVLAKMDDAGQLVGGAEYELYHKSDIGDAEFVKYGTYVTETDKSKESYGEIEVKDLPWGDYYFIETKAPVGYEVSTEQVKFVIDRNTVQNTVYVQTTDNRMRGSVVLKKVDKERPETTLAGAVYELYRTDGTKCVKDQDYTLPEGCDTIKTLADGTIRVNDLLQGGYYFKEVTAPESYTISDELIRFSVTKENAAVVQALTAADERGKAVITIKKEANEVYTPFGTPTFLFEIIRDDGYTVRRSITLTEADPTGSVTVTVDQGHTYTIREVSASRYQMEVIVAGENVKVEDQTATADLTTADHADLTFKNQIDQYEKVSHVTNATNMVKPQRKLTGIHAEYHGPEPITQDLDGYDPEEERYYISSDDVTVTGFYDDGTEETLATRYCTLTPPFVDGNSNSYTGTVAYNENGSMFESAFTISVALPKPTPRYTVTFELNGGTIIPDGGNSAQETLAVQVKQGRQIERPQHNPKREGYTFKGWFTDSALTNEAIFPVVVTQAVTYYAKWEQKIIKVKYAVSIYGIQQDTDDQGNIVGLTFGPATGDDYTNSYKSHIPSENTGQMCMHNMTWNEIIAQSKKDPSVFHECLENGCTHSVELTITGKLAKGATSYPNMMGDGTGILNNSISAEYHKWNRAESAYFDKDTDEYRYSVNTGGWPDSAIRNTLNGTITDNMLNITNKDNGFKEAALTENEALIASFPAELQNEIIPKAVRSDTVYNDLSGNNVTTYDKLWLFSGGEIWGNSGNNNDVIRPNEGNPYERQILFGITTSNYNKNRTYCELNFESWWWTRSLYYNNEYYVYFTGCRGDSASIFADDIDNGISPGFCLPGPKPKPDVKYAVSLYGIEHDTYSEDNGLTTDTAGLTFGPATSASYVSTYQSHTPTGTTSSGNAHRCIHDDDWNTIAEWSKKDPYVYEQCYGDETTPSCTKAVPLTLNIKIKQTSYPNMTGDGAGILCDSIKPDYSRWNHEKSAYFTSGSEFYYGTNKGGWPDSAIRNTLNGITTDNMFNITNKDNRFADMVLTESEALISSFPAALKNAIVPKAVQSDTVYNDVSKNNITTYDKLWLFSGNEIYKNYGGNNEVIRPNEGVLYERQTALDITTSVYSHNATYTESGWTRGWWLRSPYRDLAHHAYCVGNDGDWVYSSVYDIGLGLAPGFCLK